MKDHISLKVFCVYAPLIRLPLLLNNLVVIILTAFAFHHVICIAELAFILASSLVALVDLIIYFNRQHALRRTLIEDRELHVNGCIMLADAVLMIGLLIIWVIGIITLSTGRWYDSKLPLVAIFGAFLAWLSHSLSLFAQKLFWKYSKTTVGCKHCGHGLVGVEIEGAIQITGDVESQPRQSVDTLYNEHEDGEIAVLLAKDGGS